MSDPIDDPLSALAGHWRGEETILPTPWGPGGPAHSRIVARPALDGRVLLYDYAAERDGAAWLSAHAVFGADEAGFRLHWFDSLGFVPTEPAPGRWQDGALVFERRSPRGRTRHVYAFEGAERHTLALDSSFDDGASWTPVMRGIYVRDQTP